MSPSKDLGEKEVHRGNNSYTVSFHAAAATHVFCRNFLIVSSIAGKFDSKKISESYVFVSVHASIMNAAQMIDETRAGAARSLLHGKRSNFSRAF